MKKIINVTLVVCLLFGGSITLNAQEINRQPEPTSQKWRTFDEYNSRYPGTHALALFVDDKDVLWVGTKGAGVVSFDGKTWTNYTRKNGLAGNVVHSIAQSKDGMWFGTFTDGVSFFDGKKWINYNTLNGLANNFVRAIAVHEEKIWFGTLGGVGMFDGEKWHKYTVRGEYAWFRGQWQLKRPYAVIEGLPLNEIWDLKVAPGGVVWAATYNGLAKFNSVNWLTFRPPKDSLSDNEIKSLAVDENGGVWIGTHLGGLVYYVDQQKKWTVYTTEHGLANMEVTAITVQDDDVWIGTLGGGVSHYNPRHGWISFTAEDGLSGNFVISLASQKNRVWAGFYGPGISVMEVGK